MNPRYFLALSLLLAAGLQAEGEPTERLFPADRDGAPAPLVPLDAPRPEGRRPVLREKVEQLRESGITREDMQRVREALEQARGDETVKAARKKADAAQEKLRGALRAYAEAHGIQPPDFPEKIQTESPKQRPDLTPEQLAERRARKVAESGERKPAVSMEKMAEIRKVMEGARNDPAVKSAFEETRVAGEALRQAVRASMLKSDPSLAPLIDKLGDLREAFRDEHKGPGPKRDGSRGQQSGQRGEKRSEPAKEPGA